MSAINYFELAKKEVSLELLTKEQMDIQIVYEDNTYVLNGVYFQVVDHGHEIEISSGNSIQKYTQMCFVKVGAALLCNNGVEDSDEMLLYLNQVFPGTCVDYVPIDVSKIELYAFICDTAIIAVVSTITKPNKQNGLTKNQKSTKAMYACPDKYKSEFLAALKNKEVFSRLLEKKRIVVMYLRSDTIIQHYYALIPTFP